MLLIKADAHREGLTFPPYVYNKRIETEGLAAMARSMGIKSWGMPHVEIMHK
jgi:mannan polymerase complexes MNN9 subunit